MSDARRNSNSIPEQWLSDAWIDRLVDGELSPAEYRAVVEALDRHPEHWRRCAQAFLEAQAFRQELSGWMEPAPAASEQAPVESPAIVASLEQFASDSPDDESDDADWDRSRLTASPSAAIDKSIWTKVPRSWNDYLAPLASVAVLLIVFVTGWQVGQPRDIESIGSGNRESVADSGSKINPMGHVRLAVDGRSEDVTVPYYYPADYANVSRVSTSSGQGSSVEQLIGNRAVERQRAVMPSRLDERRDVLLPIEVISIPGQTDFQ